MSALKNQLNGKLLSCLTIDVEDCFHILDTPAAPKIDDWASLESRVDIGVNRLLELLDKYSVRATMFWLGWIAERNKDLLRRCVDAGHEIASHGYAHVLAYEVGPERFFEDIRHGKAILEDIAGREVRGFRAAGFSTRDDTDWTFEKISLAGHSYDSSVFPASRGHGGMTQSLLVPYTINTNIGNLVEIPQSMIEIFGKRISFFGGGYLRLAPKFLVKRGIKILHKAGHPLIVYVHPREVDPAHPRLPLSLIRRFKCYVNLKSILPKLEMLCRDYKFVKMHEIAEAVYQTNKLEV